MELQENQYLITQIQNFLDEQETEERVKTSFWATETETPVFDLYHKWIGTEPTNPIEAEKLMMFKAAKMMELSLIAMLREMDVLEEDKSFWKNLFKKNNQHRIEFETHGIKVSGYLDGLLKDNMPLEIKSFYGDYQTKELKSGKPKESYLKQLAIYMFAKNAQKGKLIYIHRGTGEMFEFTLIRTGETTFKCMSIEFDLEDIFKRWARLYKNNIVPKVEPKSEFRYKIPVEEIDFTKISKSDISKARNNHKVIGDSWQVAYSPYKDLIIEREGTIVGYTNEELEKIKEATQGFTTWGK